MPSANNAAARRIQFNRFALRIAVAVLGLLTLALFSSVVVSLIAQEPSRDQPKQAQPIDLKAIKPDLIAPAMKEATPAPGLRVKQQLPTQRDTGIYHALYLPKNWSKDRSWPVIVEYPGNGPYSNNLGDTNSGLVEDCNLAYGVSGGEDFICLTLPFVNAAKKENQRQWWGDPQATVDYCLAAVELICHEYGGDAQRLVLAGFSRGAIACNYIGLRNDKIAKLWKCFIVHSHYDGVRRWPYDDSDAASARERLARLNGRAQWISHEGTIAATEQFLKDSQPANSQPLGKFTFQALPFPNHTDTWLLRDIAPRTELRRWLREQLAG
ncbi:hypothetical protein [Anatilimnocola floriformis]|uniref:hypothetical protein n=1 Tax=Anatilimnocola floriformis TaxID=2948575 RepID=UPI0020C267BE|nr:hypothetical protein [Anatilimnocola floriformis]